MKRIIAIILMVALMASLTACGKKEPEPTELVLDQLNSIDNFMDFKLIKLYSGEKLYDSMGNYHYSSESGKVYVDAVFDVKNTGEKAIEFKWYYGEDEIPPIEVTAENFDGTIYDSSLITIENGGYTELSNDGTIAPQASARVHITAIVSASETDLTLNFKVNGQLYCYSYTVGTTVATVKEIALNEEIEITDYAKYTFIAAEVTDDVKPSKTEGSYSHYTADEGNSYVVLKFNIINLGGTAKEYEDLLNARVKYMGKYEYSGFIVAEDSDGEGFDGYGSVDPLVTKLFYVLIQVPDSVAGETAEFSVFINGNEYKYTYSA